MGDVTDAMALDQRAITLK